MVLVSRRKCTGFFDFSCHIQYICMSWMLMFGLLLAILPIGTPHRTNDGKPRQVFCLKNPGFEVNKYLDILLHFEFQLACYFGFYIKREYLILFTTGGKIVLGLENKESDISGGMDFILTCPKSVIRDIISMKQGIIINMMLKESVEIFIMIKGTTISSGIVIISIIFTMFTRVNINMGEPGVQVLCNKFTWTEGKMILLSTVDAKEKQNLLRDYAKF